MDNMAKPSVIKNHIKSFRASMAQVLEYLNDIDIAFTEKSESVLKLADERIKLINALEVIFQKYNLKYEKPLYKNSIEQLKNYVSYLDSEIVISAIDMDKVDREEVVKDSLFLASTIAKIESITNYLEINSREVVEEEKKLNSIRIPERDSDDETLHTDFQTLIADRKRLKEAKKTAGPKIIKISDSPEEDVEVEVKRTIPKEEDAQVVTSGQNVDADTISPDIFKGVDLEEEAKLDEASINEFFANKFGSFDSSDIKKEELDVPNEEFVSVILKGGFSLADVVAETYGSPEYWEYVYNYSDSNREAIDRKSYESDMELIEAVFDKNALSGISIDLPTELVTYTKISNEDKVDDGLAPVYVYDNPKGRGL